MKYLRQKDGRSPTIGVPRGFIYYRYFPLINEFFTNLGCVIVVSSETNKKILENGINLAVDESCLSLKIFLGHVNELLDKVDYIFVPRIVRVIKKESLCTKFLAMPDIVSNTFAGINLIDPNIEQGDFGPPLIRSAKVITRSYFKRKWAFKQAERKQKEFEDSLMSSSSYSMICSLMNLKKSRKKDQDSDINIALLGHPYNVYDKFLGFNVASKLEKMGVGVKTLEMLSHERAHKAASEVTTDMYWTFNKEIMGATQLYIEERIDGVIYLTTFPCGPDGLCTDLAIRTFSKRVPIMNLVFDELEGEAGLDTRLEIFSDMLRIKKKAEAV